MSATALAGAAVQAPAGGAARARLERLCDPDSLQPRRSAVADGVIGGLGRIAGRPVYVWAQDPAHLGGSLGAAGGETIARLLTAADRAGAPIVGFLHSGGARMQEGVAALSAYAAIFRAQARLSVPQIAVVCGPCAGGAAYSPALGDLTVIAGPEARVFLTGPKIVERVTREQVSSDDLGGPRALAANGIGHLLAADEAGACRLVREALAHLPDRLGDPAPVAPALDPEPGDPAGVVPAARRRVYDVRAVIRRLVDGGAPLELAGGWARNLVCALARIEGAPVGVLANQPRHLGGTIDAAAAEKGAWFVSLCDRLGLPLVVLVDTPGFLPGVRQERSGVIRHGAAFLRAFARAGVPRVTVTLRQAYGGAHIVMNSRDLGADLALAWSGASVGVMGARQAVELVQRRAIAAGADPELLAEHYAGERLAVAGAAAAGHVDEVIEPADTRARIAAELGAHRR